MSQTSSFRLIPELTLAAAAIVGSVEHHEHGKNDDWDWDSDAGITARVMIPMWNLWSYEIFVLYAPTNCPGFGDDWIQVHGGYVPYNKGVGPIMTTYESFRNVQGIYREVKLKLQQFTFTEAHGYRALDCR